MKLSNILAAGLTATLLSAGASYAQSAPATPAEVQVVIKNEMAAQMPEVMALVEELKAQGYTYIEIRRTLLGRAKVMAEGPNGTREIVISAATGEVMRDAMHDGDHLAKHGDMADGEHGDMGERDHGSDGENGMSGGMGGSSMGGGMGSN